MKFIVALCVIMIVAERTAWANTAKKTTPKAPHEVVLTVSDGAGSKDGYCKVYASAPTGAVLSKTHINLGKTKFVGTYRRKVFGKSDMVVGGKVLGELKKAHKAKITLDITYMKKNYKCSFDYAPNNNCSYSHKYKCKNASFLSVSLLALAFISAFFF